jgi:hydrogenase/urease accessory protein HupE
MDKEDIDKNLELVLYILLGFFGGLISLVAVGLTAYVIGYKRLKRLIIGFFIGALIYGILSITVLYNLPFVTYLVLAFIIVVIALAIAHIIHEDRSRIG